jgi:antirestriction protein ArdC
MYANKLDVVTQKLIKQMEAGKVPWQKPWKSGRYKNLPFNATTGAQYHGINILLLWLTEQFDERSCNGWMTFYQMRKIKANLIQLPNADKGKTGQKSTLICKSDTFIPAKDFIVRDKIILCRHTGESRTRNEATQRFYKWFNVFNLDQLENLPEGLIPPLNTKVVTGISERLSTLFDKFPVETKHGDKAAYYVPTKDYIGMPAPTDFKTIEDYISTRLHEMVHSSGHPSRLARVGIESDNRTKEKYAFEELVAEIGSAYLCAEFNISGKLQHASYLQSYIKVLENDSRAIFRAAADAQRAVDWILEYDPSIIKEAA